MREGGGNCALPGVKKLFQKKWYLKKQKNNITIVNLYEEEFNKE